MSEIIMAIWLVYLTSGITSGIRVYRDLNMTAILKILKYYTKLQFDLRYEKTAPNYAKKSIFHGDDVIDDVAGWPPSFPWYSCLVEVSCKGNDSSINATRMGNMISTPATPTLCLEQKSENFQRDIIDAVTIYKIIVFEIICNVAY